MSDVIRTTPTPAAPFSHFGPPPSGRDARTFTPRNGRMKDHHRVALESLAPALTLSPKVGFLDQLHVFGRVAPLVVEVGFGMGESTIAIAEAHRDWDIVGIEVYPNGHGAVALAAQERALTNIRLINADALDVLAHMIAPESLSLLTTFFPDPWPKVAQKNRRLIVDSFTELVASRLSSDGVWRMATDWADYANQMVRVVNESTHVANVKSNGGYSERWADRPLTKFERRGIREARAIYDLAAVRAVRTSRN
jgi:tRNA (guanine-N7-)-methyltransferase